MDYTNFVKTYYRTALKHLNRFQNYDGFFNTLNYGDGIKPEYTHFVPAKLDVLPSYELNIDAPTTEYEKFMEYYSEAYPQLGTVLVNVENLYKIYNNVASQSLLNDDEKAIDYIDMIVEVSVDILQQTGVLK